MPKKSEFNFIDVFAGAGGLSCGMEMAGMTCVLGIDADKHAMRTFAHNHKKAEVFCGDVTKLTKAELKRLTGGKKIHAVVGGPPCQGFSTVGLGNPDDIRNTLFRQFVRIVKETKPDFVVVENVTGMLAKKNEQTLKAILKCFKQMGYPMDVRVLSAHEYGVPEMRRRTILIGNRIGADVVFPVVTHSDSKKKKPVTVAEALKDIADKKGKTHNHDLDSAKLPSKIDEKRLERIPQGHGIRYERDEKKFLTKALSLGVDWKNLREGRFRQTKYFRLDGNKPSPTIMTHRHSYYHPTETRYLTQREAARLQSFPNNFVFFGPLSAQWRQIGNAVPPLLGKALGLAIYKMISNKKSLKQKKTVEETLTQVRSSAFMYRPTSMAAKAN
ncbi:MAG: DNA (cytosine-5-)-methyltransferase [Halobacteriovorax sp.]|nr:DNA (cytosine-5-)-methyltransferase [Halobacteriovorax sp.]